MAHIAAAISVAAEMPRIRELNMGFLPMRRSGQSPDMYRRHSSVARRKLLNYQTRADERRSPSLDASTSWCLARLAHLITQRVQLSPVVLRISEVRELRIALMRTDDTARVLDRTPVLLGQ